MAQTMIIIGLQPKQGAHMSLKPTTFRELASMPQGSGFMTAAAQKSLMIEPVQAAQAMPMPASYTPFPQQELISFW